MSKRKQREARLRGLHNSAIANNCIQERGRMDETNYAYSIISPPPILVARPNQQKVGGGGVISSEYGKLTWKMLGCIPFTRFTIWPSLYSEIRNTTPFQEHLRFDRGPATLGRAFHPSSSPFGNLSWAQEHWAWRISQLRVLHHSISFALTGPFQCCPSRSSTNQSPLWLQCEASSFSTACSR